MAWGTIRRATDEDVQKLEQRAQAFVQRHPELETVTDQFQYGYVEGLEFALANEDLSDWDLAHLGHLARLWKRVVQRALDHPWADGVAWGYVGYHCQ